MTKQRYDADQIQTCTPQTWPAKYSSLEKHPNSDCTNKCTAERRTIMTKATEFETRAFAPSIDEVIKYYTKRPTVQQTPTGHGDNARGCRLRTIKHAFGNVTAKSNKKRIITAGSITRALAGTIPKVGKKTWLLGATCETSCALEKKQHRLNLIPPFQHPHGRAPEQQFCYFPINDFDCAFSFQRFHCIVQRSIWESQQDGVYSRGALTTSYKRRETRLSQGTSEPSALSFLALSRNLVDRRA